MKSLPGRIFIVIIYGALSITQLQWTKSISILSLLNEMIISCSMQFYEPRLRYSSALCPKWLFELTVVIHWRIIQCKVSIFWTLFEMTPDELFHKVSPDNILELKTWNRGWIYNYEKITLQIFILLLYFVTMVIWKIFLSPEMFVKHACICAQNNVGVSHEVCILFMQTFQIQDWYCKVMCNIFLFSSNQSCGLYKEMYQEI